MTNYLKAELYRISHKKGTLIYIAALFIAFLIEIIYLATTNKLDAEIFNFIAPMLIAFLPVLIGIPIFITIYNDDISAKNLSAVISSGINKYVIPLSKLVICAISLLVVYIFVALVFYTIVFFALNNFVELDNSAIFGNLIVSYLSTLGFFSLASIITYTFQKSSLSLISIILLILGFITQLLNMLKLINNNISILSDNTLTSHVAKTLELLSKAQGFDFKFIGIAAIYIIASILIATFIFNKKDVDVA